MKRGVEELAGVYLPDSYPFVSLYCFLLRWPKMTGTAVCTLRDSTGGSKRMLFSLFCVLKFGYL